MNRRKIISSLACLFAGITGVLASGYTEQDFTATIALKTPGNAAVHYPLALQKQENSLYAYRWVPHRKLPLSVYQDMACVNGNRRVTVFITALDDIYFSFGGQLRTGFRHDDCLFYMPGFWYRRNLRSPAQAPSFHTSDSWVVREDRLSTPLTAVFDQQNRRSVSVVRLDDFKTDALATHTAGEVILSGRTSVGYTGFENAGGTAVLAFGFPYKETPKAYLRKLTLAPPVEAYQFLRRGESISLVWEVRETPAADFAECVRSAWEYSYDTYRPQPVETPYTPERMKEVLSRFFTGSFVGDTPVNYYSGVELRTDDCARSGTAEVGFVGRTLLNAFNALEYGRHEPEGRLATDARRVFDSYLRNGFSAAGFFREVIRFDRDFTEPVHSIRRQSEGVYAVLHYLAYEKRQGRRHPEWEKRIRGLLDAFVRLQNNDGSFPRKFADDYAVLDKSGGSTPSATLPLVMGYVYFKDKRYLAAARRTVEYLEHELISRSDYFSSTLDANCEDKEASLYASTAAYYLALVTRGEERARYAALSKQAAYFALSWYYTWDVPFAPGQMLGDLGLKTRGWGNVSVENNHIDVFVFGFADVLDWLADEYGEKRFSEFAGVMRTSMRQLLPYEGQLCGVALPGFYPEVVQHTQWDYGKNGKGYYNDLFAPGWTVASLWELFTPGRAARFIGK